MEETKLIPLKDFKEGEEVESEMTFDGDIKFKRKSNVSKGRKSRASGAQFELRVRKDLEEKDWIVDKWSNNVDLVEEKVVAAKKHWKYNPFRKAMMPKAQGTGFPDFIAFQLLEDNKYKIIGVEVKLNGLLSKEEKEKCVLLLNKKIFSEIWIAQKEKQGTRVVVKYIDFRERYKKQFV